MDDADVPMDGRCLVIPPSVRNAIMGIDRYSSSDFVDGRVVNNGQIGNLYGIDIYVSSNCPVIETAADNGAGGDVKAGYAIPQRLLWSYGRATRVFVHRLSISKTSCATLYTADTLYGTASSTS